MLPTSDTGWCSSVPSGPAFKKTSMAGLPMAALGSCEHTQAGGFLRGPHARTVQGLAPGA